MGWILGLMLSALVAGHAQAEAVQFRGNIVSSSYSEKSAMLAVLSATGNDGDAQGFIQIVDVKSGTTKTQFSIDWISPDNTKIALSQDAQRIVVAINGIPLAKIWSVETGKVISEIRLGEISKRATLKPYFSPSGESLAVIDRDDGSLKVFEARTGEMKKRIERVEFGAFQTFGGYLSSEDEFIVAVKDGLVRLDLKTGQMSETFAAGSYFVIDFAGDFAKQIFILSSLEGLVTMTQWNGVTGDEGPKVTFEDDKNCSSLFPYEDHIAVGCYPRGRAGNAMEIHLVK